MHNRTDQILHCLCKTLASKLVNLTMLTKSYHARNLQKISCKIFKRRARMIARKYTFFAASKILHVRASDLPEILYTHIYNYICIYKKFSRPKFVYLQ